MLYCNRINLSKGVDAPKSNNSKEYTIYHYWYLKHGFYFQKSVAIIVMIC